MASMIGDIDPNSEIANSVQQEYRRFVNYAEPELGTHETTADGKVVRSSMQARASSGPRTPPMVESLPAGGAPASAYWEQRISQRQNKNARAVTLSVDDVINRMISQSNQLAAISDVPLIRDTVANEATGRFDPFIFADSEYESTEQPRSSLLETGTSSTAPENLADDRFTSEFGIGQPLITGGEVRLSQRLGTENSNSDFFVPDDQANADIALEIRQPLLDGAGVLVNTAPIHVAKLERDRSIAELQRQIEDQFTEVMRTYWTLYAERAHLLQRQRLVGDLRGVAEQISARAEFDTLAGEREQAAAAIRRAEASTIRARSGVDNAQARLSALLSDPSLYGDRVEIIPGQRPVRKFTDVPLEDVALLALQNRPEVKSVALQLRAAELQAEVAKNKLLPDLDVRAGISNGGLSGDYDVGNAWSNQFDQTDVDGFVGVRFKMPLGNRSDRSINDRRRIEVRQLTSQLRNVSDTVLLEAQVAVREARTAYEEMRARQAQLAANNTEIAALRARADEGLESGSAFLATLISGMEDRTESEQRLLEAVVSYNLALYQVERVAGTMLSSRGVEALRIDTGNLDHIAIVRRALGKDRLPVGADSNENLLVNPRAIERGVGGRNGGQRDAP
ncbi:TolC family protein [Mesorhizobium xinjiangense]|uniref:TolC family protein n=1 Tax=Mesorhizobium xinjiangense TaxID=2678685 RepID=UPI0018DE6D8F|nr:TolC family protein [Mesorhizobium xinjiangense]